MRTSWWSLRSNLRSERSEGPDLGSERTEVSQCGLSLSLEDLIWGSEGLELGSERPDLWFDSLRGQS